MKPNFYSNNATATLGMNHKIGSTPALQNRINNSFNAEESFKSWDSIVKNSNLRSKDTQPTTAEKNSQILGKYINESPNMKSNQAMSRSKPGATQALQAGAESAGAISQGYQNSWIIGENGRITNNYYNRAGGAFGNFVGQDHRAMMQANAESRALERTNNYSNTGKAFAGPFGQFVGAMVGRGMHSKILDDEMSKTNFKFATNNMGKAVDPKDSVTSTYHEPVEQKQAKGTPVLSPSFQEHFFNQSKQGDPHSPQSIDSGGGRSLLHPNNPSPSNPNISKIPLSQGEAVNLNVDIGSKDNIPPMGGSSVQHPNNNNSTNTNLSTSLSEPNSAGESQGVQLSDSRNLINNQSQA